jgi:hypothetical protein
MIEISELFNKKYAELCIYIIAKTKDGLLCVLPEVAGHLATPLFETCDSG